MKSTEQRLGEVYAVKHEPEMTWYVTYIGGQVVRSNKVPRDKVEVSEAVFADLCNDRIAPWRLLEDGFATFDHAMAGTAYEFRCNEDALLTYVPLGEGLPEFHVWPTDIDGETGSLSVPYYGIHTYTDLLTLIRLIG
jgi:hypothetical protein